MARASLYQGSVERQRKIWGPVFATEPTGHIWVAHSDERRIRNQKWIEETGEEMTVECSGWIAPIIHRRKREDYSEG
jgi:hypothetical protein